MIQALHEKTMGYDSFVSTIKYLVSRRMGNEYKIRIYKVIKNNSLELDSLVVLKEGKSIAPNIYLEPYYDSYLEGTALEELAERLCTIYRHCSIPAVNENFTYSLLEMKSFIFYRLVSFSRNQKLLTTVPHMRYLDLAITFHCLVRNDDEGIGTIRITNEHVELWNIALVDLMELAVTNTERLFPATIKSMEEVIGGLLEGDFPQEDYSGEDISLTWTKDSEPMNTMKMYILTNQKGINGASCLLYKEVIKAFAKQLDSDLYILPSSIHEIILLPYDSSYSKASLAKMVKEINSTQVPCEEVLSDNVYRYSMQDNKIIL